MNINWKGNRGHRLSQVLPEVVNIIRDAQVPVILVLHIEGNDLCCVRMGELLLFMNADLERFTIFSPEHVLVWSEIILQVVHGTQLEQWKGPTGPLVLDWPILFVIGIGSWWGTTVALCGWMGFT